MASPAPVSVEIPGVGTANMEPPTIRRFELPDLDRHGGWIMQRLLAAYPHLSNTEVMGWLRGIIYSNEYQFLYQPHSVSLAQVIQTFTLLPTPIVQERFVFAQDKNDQAHLKEACEFYVAMRSWAEFKGFTTILVEEMSDVPHDMIKAKLGQRLFTREQIFVRVGKT